MNGGQTSIPNMKRRIIEAGVNLAESLRQVQSLAELRQLEPKVREFSDRFDDEFGVADDPSWPEKSTSLTMSLWVAFNWRRDHLAQPDNQSVAHLADEYLDQFVKELKGGDWT